MVSRKPFLRLHNYLLGCASELCAPILRGATRRLVPGQKSPPASWKRGLIISHTRIGDVLFRTCSLEQLKKGLPDCEWYYLAAPDSAEVLRGNPFLASVLPLCDSAGCLRLLPGAAEELRAMKLEVALCTNPNTYWQDHKVALAAKIPNRIGFVHRGLSGLVTSAVSCNYPSPWAGYFRQIVAQVTGVAPDWPLIPMMYASQEDERLALAQWKKMGLPGDAPVVACFMTTREASHVWPKDCYQATLKLVRENSGAHIVLSGSKQDASMLGEFAARCGVPCKVMAGELGLGGLFCFLKKCSAVLSPDSGPRHIANAAGTPVVFMRNLFCSKIETGRYCQNEIDLSPDAEFVPVDEQETLLRRVSPALVAQTILQLLRRTP
jgi:heptosyltransferase II